MIVSLGGILLGGRFIFFREYCRNISIDRRRRICNSKKVKGINSKVKENRVKIKGISWKVV